MTQGGGEKAAGFLGLCTRAGQVSFGQEACVAAVRSHAAQLVLLDEGCAANTRKRFQDACQTHQVPLYQWPPGEIGRAVGKDGLMVAAPQRGGMGEKLQGMLGEAPALGQENG